MTAFHLEAELLPQKVVATASDRGCVKTLDTKYQVGSTNNFVSDDQGFLRFLVTWLAIEVKNDLQSHY